MFRTSFLLPTIRDRFRDVIKTWDDEYAEFIISYDTQNPDLNRLSDLEISDMQGSVVQVEHDCSTIGGNVPVWNNIATLATGDAIFVIADDLYNKTPKWQELILSKIPTFIEQPWAVVGDDLLRLQNKTTWDRGLAGHPLLSKKYYDLFGYVWHPSYKSQWCDNEFYIVGTGIGRLIYMPEFIYENCHPNAGKSIRDQWNQMANNTMGQGYTAFQQKDRINAIIQEARNKIDADYNFDPLAM